MKEYTISDSYESLSEELGNEVQVEIKELNVSFKCVLIGMSIGKYLVMNTHQIDGITKEQLKSNNFVITYMQRGAFLGFCSCVISIISNPENIVFIEYPKVIENYDRRTNKRIDCFLPARFDIGNYLVDGPIVDVSNKGCCCRIKDEKIANEIRPDKITILIPSSEHEDVLSVFGEVKSIRDIKGATGVGVLFEKMDSNKQNVMQSLVPELSLRR